MSETEPDQLHVTALLDRVNQGDTDASDELLPLVYEELHGLAARVFGSQKSNHTLQATALVHEAYLRMLGNEGAREGWHGRRHFFAVAAKAMRRVLIDHARRGKAAKREGVRVTLAGDVAGGESGYDLLELGDAFEELGKVSERVAQIVELRFLGGLSVDEVAEELGVSRRTVFVDWRAGRAWLRTRFVNTG